MTRVYVYRGCDSCRKALKWLRARGIAFEEKAIRETPPERNELEAMLTAYGGDLRRLFNTSGADYRELGLKDRLPGMGRDEAFELLAANGNLVKRPFVVGDGVARMGFDEDGWEVAFEGR